uniref:Uncharacterized protein LOC104217144 n=1 Tax=Nicotiana sylvestris TaxID=4096 RepID=A0A1U7VGX5_NICSY|nr:PREDICTED: uncharacterized protein LOC104217144 [Nicotiana sylvestris]
MSPLLHFSCQEQRISGGKSMKKGTMIVSEYAIRFSELARRAPTLVPSVKERVRKFIEGLDYDIKICMARELHTNTPFQQVVEIARRIEGVLAEEKGYKETKRSQSTGGFSGFYSSGMNHYGEGSSSRSAQSAHQSTRGNPVSSISAPPA